MNTDLHLSLFGAVIRLTLVDSIQYFGQFIAEEHRNYRGRRFVRAQTVVVTGGRDRDTEKILMLVNRLNNSTKEKKELSVFVGMFAGLEKVYPFIGGKRPVVVLTAACNTLEGFFLKDTNHSVSFGNLFHSFHRKLVMVGSGIRRAEHGCKLVLARCGFVMLGFGKNTEFPKFFVKFLHKRGNAGLDSAEVVVLEFLTLGRLCAEKGSAADNKVLAFVKQFFIYKEIFLFGSYVRLDMTSFGTEKTEDP